MAAKGYNPFDQASFVIDDEMEAVNNEEFLSSEAGADFLDANDTDAFVFGNTTLASVRMADDTFQNQTIGQYLGQGSADMESSLFIEPPKSDIALTSDIETADRKESHSASSQKDVVTDEHQSFNDEPVFLFSSSDFLKLDESIPQSPPSFLQAVDSSLFDMESPQNSQPGFDNGGEINSPSPPTDNTHHQSSPHNEEASTTKDQTVASAFESMGFIASADRDNSTNNAQSVPVIPTEELHHQSSCQSVLSALASSSSSRIKSLADNAIGMVANSESINCPPDMSTFLKEEDDEWDFTLTDINQMVEGVDKMDLGDVFAQILAKKKEKVKSQKLSTNQQETTPAPVTEKHQYSPPSSTSVSAATNSNPSISSSVSPIILDSSALVGGDSDPDLALNSSIRQQLMESVRPGHGHHRGRETSGGNGSMACMDDSIAGVSLCCDNNMTLPNNLTMTHFAASTPMYNHQPNLRDLGLLRQSAIHHIVSPTRIQEVLDLPTHVDVPEVCCVFFSQQVQFTIRNKLKSGVQCTFSISKMAYNGKVMEGCVGPFDFNRRITLCPSSQETVQILFNPTCAGHFYASLEVTAQNLINPTETRVYETVLTGRAEYPKFKVLPNGEEINFGDLIWGSSDCKTIKIQNAGQATVPIRFTIVRTNSPLCSFSFQPSANTTPDVTNTLLTGRPHSSSHSVISMSLPGVRHGEPAVTHSIDVYCHVKTVDTALRKYNESCEVFEGVLTIEMDSPIQRQKHLTQYRLRVRTGMVKLHLDKSELVLSSLPGQTKEGTVKVVNSGNISMKVTLNLEPSTNLFHVTPKQMLVDPHSYQLARVAFTPHEQKNDDVRLVLSDPVCINFLPVKGQTRHHIVTKITANASSLFFGGVPTGDKITKPFKFSLDQEVMVKCFIRQGTMSPFQVASDDGMVKDSIEMAMTKGVRSSVNVVFIPEEVKCMSATLVLQVVQGDSFSIPLSGYGGVSSITFTGVKEASSGETVIPVRKADGVGSPFTHCVTATNTGVRCAFIKAVFHDASNNVMNPHQATVMPSELFLAPQESQEMVIWMQQEPDPSTRSAGSSRLFLQGIVKLSHGDEINRQMLRRNRSSECQRHALNYVLELTQDQKTVLNAEMQYLPRDTSISLNAFKSSVKSKKIGLLAGMYAAEIGESSAQTRSTSSNPSLGPRPVLQTVHFNTQQQMVPSKGDKEWSLSPVSISFKVLDARSKDFAQIINYTDKEMRFYVEADACLSVIPTTGIVSSKSWCKLEMTTSSKFWSASHKASSALIKVRCNGDTKHIRVLIEGDATVSKMIFPPVFSDKETATAESSRHLVQGAQSLSSGEESNSHTVFQGVMGQRLANSCHQQRPVRSDNLVGIRGPEMVIIPPVSLGDRTEFTYVFTNISQETIAWKALPTVPLSCEPGSLDPTSPMQSSVFSPHPLSGTLEAGGVQTIALGFTPLTAGSYRQVWGVEYVGASFSNIHCFTIYAKSNPRDLQSGTQEAPTSPKRQQSRQHQPSLSQPHQHQPSLSQPQHQQQPSSSQQQQRQQQPSSLQQQRQPANSHTAQKPEAVDNFPKWTSCQPQSKTSRQSSTTGISTTTKTAVSGLPPSASSGEGTTDTTSVPRPSSSAAQTTKQPNASGDNQTDRCLQLIEKVLLFSTVEKGRSKTLYLRLKNTSTQDADITVEQEPRAPFIIRHSSFTVGKDRMTKVPVVFKPLHVSKFKEKVVMREKRTNMSFTAILQAECVP